MSQSYSTSLLLYKKISEEPVVDSQVMMDVFFHVWTCASRSSPSNRRSGCWEICGSLGVYQLPPYLPASMHDSHIITTIYQLCYFHVGKEYFRTTTARSNRSRSTIHVAAVRQEPNQLLDRGRRNQLCVRVHAETSIWFVVHHYVTCHVYCCQGTTYSRTVLVNCERTMICR